MEQLVWDEALGFVAPRRSSLLHTHAVCGECSCASSQAEWCNNYEGPGPAAAVSVSIIGSSCELCLRPLD